MSDLPWLRLYSNMIDNAKVKLLAFDDRWHFIAILCCKQQGIIDGNKNLVNRKLAIKLGVQLIELDEIKRRLYEVELIDQEWQPIGWETKQFKSDSSSERTRKYREKNRIKQSETSQERHSDALDTDTDTDTDTDKKKNIKKENSTFDQFWKEYPKKSGKHEALKAWNKKNPPIDTVLNALHWQKVSRQWSEGFVPNPATYINQGRWEDEPEKINVMPLPRGSPSFKTQQAEINARSIFGVNHERDITEESREFENRKIT